MKKIAFLLGLTVAATALTGPVWADQKAGSTKDFSTTVAAAPATQQSVNNPYYNAGFEDPKEFTTFLAKLQKAVSESKSKEVAELMSYPLNVNKSGKTFPIYTKEEFVQKYDRIMTANVRAKLLAQKPDQAFSNSNGIMIGDGELWISKINNRVVVYAVNVIENPYEVAGIDNPVAFAHFFNKLQKDVAANNKAAVADSISYPLRVNTKGKSMQIKTKKEFIAKYNDILTAKVKKKFLAQKEDKLFVNWQGVMVGDGELWIGQVDKKISVIAVNR
ncbi:hypothetical protein [Paenibacillus sp. NPDC057934]|uniref:hypothetical protein n=1 Tax=Paenibacillus sp. NPDC057934 TaxID=3346282 RepID=UPI0036D90B79